MGRKPHKSQEEDDIEPGDFLPEMEEGYEKLATLQEVEDDLEECSSCNGQGCEECDYKGRVICDEFS